MTKTKKLLNWLGNILLVFLLIVSALALLHSFQTKNGPGQPFSIFGYQMMTVLSGSMEPVLDPGDIVVTKKTNPTKVNVNDVITYKMDQGTLVTHRIIDIVQKDGDTFFQTKGDANNIKDEALVSSDQLVGSLSFHIPKAGYVLHFFKSPAGIVMLITFVIIILGMRPLIKALASSKSEDKNDIAT